MGLNIIKEVPMKLYRIYKDDGVKEINELIKKNLTVVNWKIMNYCFDKRWNVDTRGSIQSVDLNIKSKNIEFGVRYEPTPVKTFKSVMDNLDVDYSQYSFIDFGSGKGRALLLASRYTFKKITGIEYASDLHEIAVHNIDSYRNPVQKCRNIESVCIDATNYSIPEGPCIFYFYQPFTLDVMEKVLLNIKLSWAKNPRPFYFILLHPHAFALEKIRAMNIAKSMDIKKLPKDHAYLYVREAAIFYADPATGRMQ